MEWDNKTLIIDNFDSFTWNLVHLLEKIGDEPIVVRADDPDLYVLSEVLPRRLILSPGPGCPANAHANHNAIKVAYKTVPILGVCLGHQSIAQFFGHTVKRAPTPIHGKTSSITHLNTDLFMGIPSPFIAMRYHSLAIDAQNKTSPLYVTAWCHIQDQIIPMAIKHRTRPIAGVQFHPESFLTENGRAILENFLSWI